MQVAMCMFFPVYSVCPPGVGELLLSVCGGLALLVSKCTQCTSVLKRAAEGPKGMYNFKSACIYFRYSLSVPSHAQYEDPSGMCLRCLCVLDPTGNAYQSRGNRFGGLWQ